MKARSSAFGTAVVAAGLATAAGVCIIGTAWSRPAHTQSLSADPVFSLELDSCSYGGASIADLDVDGSREIAFGTYYGDERVIALQSDGNVLWQLPSGGGPVDNSVTVADLDRDGEVEVMWGNSGTTEFHVAASDGRDIWSTVVGEVLDAPEAVGDVDGDGTLDIVLASCGRQTGGGLRAFRGATGELLWTADVGGCYQSAPLLFDQDGDGLLDVVVSTWFDNKVRGFSGLDGSLRWETEIGDQTYHAGSFGDLNDDGVADVALGDFSATLWALSGRDGALLWSRELPEVRYVFGPTAMGDLDGDARLEIVVAAGRLMAFDADGTPQWSVDLPGYCTRGPVLVDANADDLPDVLVAVDGPVVQVRSGTDGALIVEYEFDEPIGTDADFHPAVADLSGDSLHEMFIVYGRGHSDDREANWGRAALLRLGSSGPEWPTFSHDHHHSGNYHYPPGAEANRPTATATPSPSPQPSPTATAPAARRAYLPYALSRE